MAETPSDKANEITDLPIFRRSAAPDTSEQYESSPHGRLAPLAGSRPGGTWHTAKANGSYGSRNNSDLETADGEVDWAQVRAFRRLAADRLAEQLRDLDAIDEERRREIGREIISQILDEHVRRSMQTSGTSMGPSQQARLEKSIFDALFGLGRLQPLVDDESLENIEVFGADKVVTVDYHGDFTELPPVADSEDELRDMLAFLASRGGAAERTFTENSPILHLNLHGGHRLAAIGWVASQTVVNIRRHRLVDLTLEDLQGRGTLTPELARFLDAAVRARRSIVVAGEPNSGKTTLVRALAASIEPTEKIGTFETEYELHLDRLPGHRVRNPIALESRPGSGERGPDGRAVGEISLDDLLEAALRMNLNRMIVGEVRGKEALTMFKVMQAGAGSLSTIHARDARDAIQRLATCALESGVTDSFAYRLIAHHVDLIVHIKLRDVRQPDGSAARMRYVDEVIAVEPGENGMPAVTDVFLSGPNGHAVPGTFPNWVAQLADYGYRPPAGQA
ncbi:CpaF family protein [Phytoactinopolyspora mesophila]|nr:CpaF/VirB11 family protein [Phytoactinopolyspora mesophila]